MVINFHSFSFYHILISPLWLTTFHRTSCLIHFFMYYFSGSFRGTAVLCSTSRVRGYICPTLDKFYFIHGTSQWPLIFKITATCKYFLFFYCLNLIPSPLHRQLSLLNFYSYSSQPPSLLHSRPFPIPASRLR